ncbi:hypothetical protein EAJ06_02605 [Bacteroides intestinalis]|uniref:Uncharacterized protein n=1 Tax=Bacteroides intestinalis TaxID=329854 RepID=A0A4V1YVX5_9BACE|nr:hypothetical protein DW715_02720 [Bacteroides intestinalis]RYT82522.1 hypothetical protein EAJ06_02605 [Bacteroides intestinalis]
MIPLLFNVVSYTALLKYSDNGLQSAISIWKGCPSMGMKSMESTALEWIIILKLSAVTAVTSPETLDVVFLKLQDINIVANANKPRNNGKTIFFMIFILFIVRKGTI